MFGGWEAARPRWGADLDRRLRRLLVAAAVVIGMSGPVLAPTTEDYSSEILLHVTLPAALIDTALAMKKDGRTLELETASAAIRMALEASLPGLHAKFSEALHSMDLASKSRRQRMIAYQLAMTAFVAGSLEEGAGAGDVLKWIKDPFLSQLAAAGWGFRPYTPQ